jgi:chromosome segregation ATPase
MNATATTAAPAVTQEPSYRSPLRCLVLSFRKSRQRWKKKAQARNKTIKILKVRVGDLERSRQRHAEQSQQARAALRQAEQKIAQVQAELAQARAETAAALEKKSS